MNYESTINWLLETNNPAIRYRTLVELLDKDESNEEVLTTYELIKKQKSVINILAKQDENGLWSNKDYGVHTFLRYFTALAELGVKNDDRLNNAINQACDFISEDYSGCSTALLLRAMIMLGYHNHNKVRALISKYEAIQLFDGGFICSRLHNKKPERKSCYKASLAALLLYSACKQKNIIINNTDKLVNYFLKRDLFYSSDKSVSLIGGKVGWRFIDNFFPVEPMRIGLPLILSSMTILSNEYHDSLDSAFNILDDKIKNCDRLLLEGTLSKQPCTFGKVNEANKWITFYFLLAIKYKDKLKK